MCAVFVNANAPRFSSTYGTYCRSELNDKIRKMAQNVSQIDLVFDIYKDNSLKAQTRQDRGKGHRIAVRESTPIYKEFKEFMRDDGNKTELFEMISENIK